MPKFPDVEVQLTGEDGNAFLILGRTMKALKEGGATPEEVQEYLDEAKSGDYNHLLATTMDWVEVL